MNPEMLDELDVLADELGGHTHGVLEHVADAFGTVAGDPLASAEPIGARRTGDPVPAHGPP